MTGRRIRALATGIGGIRAELLSGKARRECAEGASEASGSGVPLLREMEKTDVADTRSVFRC